MGTDTLFLGHIPKSGRYLIGAEYLSELPAPVAHSRIGLLHQSRDLGFVQAEQVKAAIIQIVVGQFGVALL